jgi:hypothetical protein
VPLPVKVIDERGFWVEDLEAFIKDLSDPEGLNDPWLAANFQQLNIYCMSEFLQERGIDFGFILQFNKNDSRIREIRFKPSAKVLELTKLKFQTVVDAVDKHSDPTHAPRDYTKDSATCRYCPFRRMCWDIKSRGGKKK